MAKVKSLDREERRSIENTIRCLRAVSEEIDGHILRFQRILDEDRSEEWRLLRRREASQ